MDKRHQLVFAKQAEVIRAVAHPLRLAILEFLDRGEQCVADIAEHIDSERSNVSRHLAVMVAAGLLDARKEGLRVFYRLRTPCILDFLTCIRRVLKQQAREHEKLLAAL